MTPAINPALELFRVLRDHHRLSWELARKELRDRYVGQIMGSIWIFAHPFIQICTLLFVYAVVFSVRLQTGIALPRDYTAYILAGLIPWLCVADTISRATTAITSKSSLVKQVVFPLEALPITNVLVGLIPQAIGLLVLIGYFAFSANSFPITAVLLPVILCLQMGFLLGFTFLLAALGVYLRDLKDVVQVALNLGIYVAPVVYLPEWVPGVFKPILYANPFSYLIWCYQDVLYFGRIEHPTAWAVVFSFSTIGLLGGFRVFRSLKPYFGSSL